MSGKNIDTLIEDVYGLLSETTDHVANEDNVHAAGELFKDVLRQAVSKRDVKTGEDVLRFSSIGKKDRQLWYAAQGTEGEVLPPSTILKFQYGHLLEILLLFLAKEAGHEVSHEQYEVEVEGVFGHMDAVIDGVPVDVKSASSYAFQKFKDGGFLFDDAFGYIPQLSGYAHAIGNTNRAAFFVVDKTTGHLCLAELDELTIKGNPPGPRINQLKEAIKLPEPPPRCYAAVPEGKSGNLKLGAGCSYCAYKDECWFDANQGQGLRKFVYSRGPVWLVNVAKEPRVEES